MPVDDREESESDFRRPPTGPWVTPPRAACEPAADTPAGAAAAQGCICATSMLSTVLFSLIVLGVGIRAYRDMSRPEAWAYWKDQYFSPSLTSSLIAKADLDGSGRGRPALAIRGKIGPAAASWLRERLDEAHLVAGDAVLLSSPGGDLGQAIIMGEIIRSHGLATAVGTADDLGPRPAGLLRQRLRARLCRRQAALRRGGLAARRPSLRDDRARERPRRRHPARPRAWCWAT